MELIRRIRQAIGPESETMILVGLLIAAAMLWVHFVPRTGWPALILPALFSLSVVGGVVYWVGNRGGWRSWLRHPLELAVRCVALAMMFVGVAMNGWAAFKTAPNSQLASSLVTTGLIVTIVTDIAGRWCASRKKSRDHS